MIAYSANEIGAGSGVTTFADDRLMDFWRDYQDDQRAAVVAPLKELETARVTTSDPTVNVVVYRRGEAAICHVLDYDYREADDTIAAKQNVEISLPWASGSTPVTVRWLTLQGEERLDCRVNAGRLVFTVPSVDPYGLAVIE